MSESKAQVPHFYLQCEIDMAKALALREELNAELADEGVKLTVNDLIVRACALALRDHPQFHRSWIDGKLYQHGAAHVGVAVALDEGLIVPVIRNADSLPLRELAVVARDLVARARSGSLRQPEIEGGTFSVSNLGMLGITSFQAIINPPEPGILAVGSVVERATRRRRPGRRATADDGQPLGRSPRGIGCRRRAPAADRNPVSGAPAAPAGLGSGPWSSPTS